MSLFRRDPNPVHTNLDVANWFFCWSVGSPDGRIYDDSAVYCFGVWRLGLLRDGALLSSLVGPAFTKIHCSIEGWNYLLGALAQL